jgi:hypothetical protein
MATSGWITDQNSNDYENVTLIAGAFAQAFDQIWNNANPLNSLETITITAIIQTDFAGRGPGPFNNPTFQDPNNWMVSAGACAALVLESDIFFSNQTINPITDAIIESYLAINGTSDDLPTLTTKLLAATNRGDRVQLAAGKTIILSTPPNGSGTYAPPNSTPNLSSNESLLTAPGSKIEFEMTYRFGFYARADLVPGSTLASAPATNVIAPAANTTANNIVIANPWSNVPNVGYLVWIEQYVGITPEVSGSSFTISALGNATIGTNDVTAAGLYGGGGTLNGKTLILTIDGQTAQTLTFAGGGNSVNLTALITAIANKWPTLFQVGVGGPSGNKLLISSTSVVIGAGTANTVLGLTTGTPTYVSILLDRPIVWQNAIGDVINWAVTYPKNINLNFSGANVSGYANQPFEFAQSQNVVIDSLNYELFNNQIPFPGGTATIGFDVACRQCTLSNSTIIFPQDPLFTGSNGLYCQSNEGTLVWNTTIRNAQVQGYTFLDCYACAGIFTNTSNCAWGFAAQSLDDTTFGSLDCVFIGNNDAGSDIGEWIWGSKRIKSLGCSTTKNATYGLLVDRNCDATTFTNQSHTNCDTGVYIDPTATSSSFVQLNTDDCHIGITIGGNAVISQWRHHSTHAESTAKCAFISGVGPNVLRDINLINTTGGNGIDIQSTGTVTIDGGQIKIGINGYCLQVETNASVRISNIVFTGGLGISCSAGSVNIGPGCDFSAATTPIVTSGSGKITFEQSGGILTFSGNNRFLLLNECYNTAIEVASGTTATIMGIPGIPGLQFTVFNGNSAGITLVSTAGSDPGVTIDAGKTAIIRVNSTNNCVRVTTPIVTSGTFEQSGGILTFSGNNRFLLLNECYNTAIEVASGTTATIMGIPGIPGLQFTVFNGNSAGITLVSTAGSDPGVTIAAGKTAIIRVNSTNNCVRVTADT